MKRKAKEVLLGARIPLWLKRELDRYCLANGVKMGHFVSQAIKDRLIDKVGETYAAVVGKRTSKGGK